MYTDHINIQAAFKGIAELHNSKLRKSLSFSIIWQFNSALQLVKQ